MHSILTATLAAIHRDELERAATSRRVVKRTSRPTRRFRRRPDCPTP
jgi:hypothetical protein